MKLIKIFSIIILILQIVFSCSTPKELRTERKEWNYKNWDEEFKERAFCLCQLKGFENFNVENTLKTYDKSYYDPIGIAIFDEVLEPIIKTATKKIRFLNEYLSFFLFYLYFL